jgi:hypothetical protein
MERNETIPKMLDFNIDWWDAARKLEIILCTSPWNQRLGVYVKEPDEAKLLVDLLCEEAIAIYEIYYTPEEFTEDTYAKARMYLRYLSKKEPDYNLCTVAAIFSKCDIDISLTDNLALYFPKIEAYVRCGDFSPGKIFGLLAKDGCKRVIIVNGAQPDEDKPEETYYSFEMRAPKEYILGRLADLKNRKTEEMREAIEKSGMDDIIPKIKYPPEE